MPDYCASTLAVAYILQENYAEAEKICTQVLQKNNSLMAAKFEQLRDYLRKVHDAVEFELSEEEGIEEDENT